MCLPGLVCFCIGEEMTVERDVVACPYCAEEILRAAQKCKHCGEYIVAQMGADSGKRRPKPLAQKVLTGLGLVAILIGGAIGYAESQSVLILGATAGGAILFLMLSGLVWTISNAFRNFVAPDAIYVRNYTWSGMFSAKLWWLFGPQFMAIGVLACFFAYIPVGLAQNGIAQPVAGTDAVAPTPANVLSENLKLGDENPLLQDPAVVDPDGDGVPNAGTDYGVARTFVMSRGMTPYVDDGNGRGETYPELWCKGGRFCQAAFLYRDAEGWGQYLVIETDAGGKVVREARSPYTAEGYVSIPPPLDIDIPNQLNRPYGKARKSLLAQGYLPAKAYSEEPLAACSQAIESDEFVDCEADVELPEVAECSGTGKAYCWAYWLAKDGRVLKITTIGEPQPGGVYHMEWASQQDLSDLPEGWRP